MVKRIKGVIDFITNGIWLKDESEVQNKILRVLLHPFRIAIYAVRGFAEHKIGVRSAALTFFTLMSLVPIAALVFGVVKGFGLESSLNDYLYATFPQYDILIDNVIEFANNLLARTKGGVVASIGFVVLLWAVMKVFSNIERAFNSIWEIKKQRTIGRKFSDYITVVFVAPILWIISNGLVAYIRTSISVFSAEWIVDILFGILSMVVLWLMFAFIYYVMPNTRVKFKGAMVAGVIAGTAFQIFQLAYVYIQSEVSSYNMIYGSFAAVPLFLIWLQTSWMIMLFGAELSFAYQNIRTYQQELESLHISYDKRRKIMLATMVVIIKNFKHNSGAIGSEMVAKELGLPVRIIRDVIFDLENAGFVAVVKSNDDRVNLYIPSRDINTITIADVVDGVERRDSAQTVIEVDNSQILAISRVMDQIRGRVESSQYNLRLIDIIEDGADSNNR